jgi:hypothetical protein
MGSLVLSDRRRSEIVLGRFKPAKSRHRRYTRELILRVLLGQVEVGTDAAPDGLSRPIGHQ